MSKKQLAKFIADQVDEFLKKGGKVKKVPEGKAKGVNDKTDAKPKNLPRDRQGKTIKFDADERSRQNINFKEGGTTKKKKKTTKSKKPSKSSESLFPKSPYLYAEEQKRKSKKKEKLSRKEQIRRGIPNQRMMDNQARDQADEFKSIPPSRKKEDPPVYHFKHKRKKENQMDRNDPEGINVKKGGLILRVTNRGPLYKGKKSGNKNS